MTRTVDLATELDHLEDYWAPRTVGTVNGTALKVVQLNGAFERHTHAEEDECFLVLEGTLVIELDDGPRTVGPGQFLVVPAGTPHAPRREDTIRMLLIEPDTTVQYGDAQPDAVVQARATAR